MLKRVYNMFTQYHTNSREQSKKYGGGVYFCISFLVQY